jgi:uncharacterized coiled-coil protein SlyX
MTDNKKELDEALNCVIVHVEGDEGKQVMVEYKAFNVLYDAAKAWHNSPQPCADVSEALKALNWIEENSDDPQLNKLKGLYWRIATIRQALTQPIPPSGENGQPKAGDVSKLYKTEPYCEPHDMCDDTYSIAWNECLDHLKSQGYLNTNERVQQLEARLEISPDHPYGGIETRNQTIKLQDKTIDDLQAKLKMATEALEKVVNDCANYSGDPHEEHLLQDVDTYWHYVQKALQQIEGEK